MMSEAERLMHANHLQENPLFQALLKEIEGDALEALLSAPSPEHPEAIRAWYEHQAAVKFRETVLFQLNTITPGAGDEENQ